MQIDSMVTITGGEYEALRADNERQREALEEIADQESNHAADIRCNCTPQDMLIEARAIARDALEEAPQGRISEAAAQPVPSGWRLDELIMAANAIIDFYNGPVEAKRPDIFQRLMQRLANALPPAPGDANA